MVRSSVRPFQTGETLTTTRALEVVRGALELMERESETFGNAMLPFIELIVVANDVLRHYDEAQK